MRNKTKGVIAGLAGAALLTGGTTFALWQDEAAVAGGIITNGELSVVAGTVAWFDVSADRADAAALTGVLAGEEGHAITDIDTWRLVPGDVVKGTFPLTVTLVGDNLVANLDVATDDAGLPTGAEAPVVSYALVDSDGVEVATGSLGAAGTPVEFVANRAGQGAGTVTPGAGSIVVDADGTADFHVVVTVDWSAEGSGATDASTMGDAIDLGDIAVSLEQVRSGSGF